jgi:hypothetical protein
LYRENLVFLSVLMCKTVISRTIEYSTNKLKNFTDNNKKMLES